MVDDTIRAYGQGQESADQLSVVILEFETDYVVREGSDQPVPRDKVILGKIGDPQYRQEYWISRLSGKKSDSPRIWDAIRPAYEAWKRGEEITHDGTPLGAVAFVPKKAVAAYRMANVHTVEQLASVEDASLSRLGLDARNHRDMARKYLDSQISGAAKIKQLEARLAEMEANAKRGPGRPPKDRTLGQEAA